MPFKDGSKQVPSSENWKEEATKVLATCDAVVCLVGPETHCSAPVNWEILESCRLGKPILVARMARDYKEPPACLDAKLSPIGWESSELAGRIAEMLLERALFSKDQTQDLDMIWKQYDVMVKSWESLISRRQQVNTLYVTAIAALLAGTGVAISSIDKTGIINATAVATLLALLGLALSFNWRRTINSYGTLSRAKSKVVAALEKHLPAQLFDAEWKILEAKKYKSTTDTDKQTAYWYMIIFFIVACVSGGLSVGHVLLSRGKDAPVCQSCMSNRATTPAATLQHPPSEASKIIGYSSASVPAAISNSVLSVPQKLK